MEERPGDERPQLPPPSLWPVGFAVGIVCLLVGLVISWAVAAVGAAIALVFGFLWARDVTRGHPQVVDEPVAEAPAAPPEPETGERFPRSRFLEGATLGLGALIGAIVTLPAAGFALLPGFLKQKQHKVDLGPISDFEENKWKVVTFARDPTKAEITRRTAFVRNNGLLNGVPSFTIISNRCAHVGCPVQPGGPVFQQDEKTIKTDNGDVLITPVLPAAGFICPCHGGSYDQEGNRIAGPPVRGLDRYEFDIVKGRLVLGDLYSVVKVEGSGKSARIKKVELHGPGQHADGPESWLYPLQPPH
ncbi:MAG TPA: Rieske (2Fe-2S) protein [Gaiellaceae bacterium]|nr:Rieske (2Fe-2S) protein [Gaiellaceae bacterium]